MSAQPLTFGRWRAFPIRWLLCVLSGDGHYPTRERLEWAIRAGIVHRGETFGCIHCGRRRRIK